MASRRTNNYEYYNTNESAAVSQSVSSSTVQPMPQSQQQQQLRQLPSRHYSSGASVTKTTTNKLSVSPSPPSFPTLPLTTATMSFDSSSTGTTGSNSNIQPGERTGSSRSMDGLPISGNHSNDSDHEDSERYHYDKDESRRSPRPSWFVIQVTIIASLGGILFGYDLGIISCALPQLIVHFDLIPKQQELVVSILYMGGVCGATIGGSICDLFGRKKSILLCDIIFGIGAIILYSAQNVSSILIGRVVVGFAIALSGIADVTYLHEIAPVQFRGAIVSVNEACIALGFLLAFGIGSVPALSYNAAVNDEVDLAHVEGWRVMFGISGFVALLQFIGMIYLPESPKWLNDRGREEESVIAQHRIQSDSVLLRGTAAASTPNEHQRKNSRTLLMSMPNQNRRGTANTSPVTVPVSSNYQTISSPGATTADLVYDENDDFDAMMVSTKSRGLLFRICCCPVYQTIYLCQQFCSFIRTMTSTQYRRQTYITMFLATTQQFCGQTNVLSYAPLIFAAASVNSSAGTDASMEAYATVSIGIMK